MEDKRFFPKGVEDYSFLVTRSFGNGFAKRYGDMSNESDVTFASTADCL